MLWFKKRHLVPNPRVIVIYFLAISIFVSGTAVGALAVRLLTEDQQAELLDYLQFFISTTSNQEVFASKSMLTSGIWANMRVVLIVWMGGLLAITLPLSLLAVFVKGLTIGFAVGFMVDEIGWRGFILASATLLPHSLVCIPTIIVLCVGAVCFASITFRHRIAFKRQSGNLMSRLPAYCCQLAYSMPAVLVAGTIEGCVTPVLSRIAYVWLL